MMRMVEITEQEESLLLELIESAEQESIQGLDHADTRAYKNILRKRLQQLDDLKQKFERQFKH